MQKKINSVIISIVSYVFFLGLGYVIAQYIEIPAIISYSIFLLFGILAVVIDIPKDKMKWLKQIPLFRRHFSIMHRVNQKIGDSARQGNMKHAFQFVIGMISIIIYLFWINLILISLKYILSLAINDMDPLRFTEAFLSLLGAGIVAFLYWMVNFYKDIRLIKKLFISSKIVDKTKSIPRTLLFLTKISTLFFGYLVWIGGELLFLWGTPALAEYRIDLLLFFLFYFIFLTIILLLIIFISSPNSTKSKS